MTPYPPHLPFLRRPAKARQCPARLRRGRARRDGRPARTARPEPARLAQALAAARACPHDGHRRHAGLADQLHRGRVCAEGSRAGGDRRPDAGRAAGRERNHHLSTDRDNAGLSGSGGPSLSASSRNPHGKGFPDARCQPTPWPCRHLPPGPLAPMACPISGPARERRTRS